MKEIKLTQGRVALVDNEDFEYINQWKWSVAKCWTGNIYYALRKSKKTEGNKTIYMHRFILNVPQYKEVDHKDHDGLNNQRNNIRICTRSQNNQNRRVKINSSSQYLGVSRHRKDKRQWVARIQVNGKCKNLLYSDNEKECAIMYNIAARKHFGNFAQLNIIK